MTPELRNSIGTVRSITIKPVNREAHARGYVRKAVAAARLVTGHGIEGDSKAGNQGRHLNVMSAETVDHLAAEGFDTAPGQLGEQLILDGLLVDSLPIGTKLQIGKTAVIKLIRLRTGCATFKRHQGVLADRAAGRMGMMAVVLIGGSIRTGDSVTVVGRSSDTVT